MKIHSPGAPNGRLNRSTRRALHDEALRIDSSPYRWNEIEMLWSFEGTERLRIPTIFVRPDELPFALLHLAWWGELFRRLNWRSDCETTKASQTLRPHTNRF